MASMIRLQERGKATPLPLSCDVEDDELEASLMKSCDCNVERRQKERDRIDHCTILAEMPA